MLTFKRFLEEVEAASIPLGWLPWVLFFRKELHLTREAAVDAVDWVRRAGTTTAPDPQFIAEDGWDHIIDWAEAQLSKEGKSIYSMPLSPELVVKGLIARVAREKYRLEIADIPEYTEEGVETDLDDLWLEMFFRREFQATREQAKELAVWFTGDRDFRDIKPTSRNPIIARWDPEAVSKVRHPGMSYEDYVQDEVADLIRQQGKDPKEYIR